MSNKRKKRAEVAARPPYSVSLSYWGELLWVTLSHSFPYQLAALLCSNPLVWEAIDSNFFFFFCPSATLSGATLSLAVPNIVLLIELRTHRSALKELLKGACVVQLEYKYQIMLLAPSKCCRHPHLSWVIMSNREAVCCLAQGQFCWTFRFLWACLLSVKTSVQTLSFWEISDDVLTQTKQN